MRFRREKVESREPGVRRPYVAPELARYGDILELTRLLDKGAFDGLTGTQTST